MAHGGIIIGVGGGGSSGPPSASGSADAGGGSGGSGHSGGGGSGGSGKLTCAHCRESFSQSSNRRGSCEDAPDCGARTCIEAVTCLQCAKCLLYHCMSDSEGDYVHPCECSNVDGHWARRWTGLALLSVLVPCLCCYVPMIGCYKCGTLCGVCGGRHVASS